MRFANALPILWLPLIAFWTFLIAIQEKITATQIEDIVPLVIYIVISFIFIIQLQLTLANKKEGFLVKAGSSNVLLICLIISSFSILLNQYKIIESNFSIILIIMPLIINIIIAELFSVSNQEISRKTQNWKQKGIELEEAQKEASKKAGRDRDASEETRSKWKEYLQKIAIKYSDDNIIIEEINRIKNILEFSSFFRKKTSISTLDELKQKLNPKEIIQILQDVK